MLMPGQFWMGIDTLSVDLDIYDGRENSPTSLLFDSKPAVDADAHSLFYQQRTLDLYGRSWRLVFDHTTASLTYTPAWFTLAAGVGLSALLCGLLLSMGNTRANAQHLAQTLTADIRRREEQIHLLLNSTAEAIYGIDLHGNCTFCNHACLQLLGYPHPEDLLGQNMHWQIHAKHADGTPFPVEDCRIYQAFQTGDRIHVDDEVLWRADGTAFPVEYWSYPQYRDGVVVGAVVSFLDITARKQTEEQLRLQALILDQIQDFVTLTDLKGTITYINQTQAKTGHFSRDEPIGQPVSDYGDDLDADATQQEILTATLTQGAWKGRVVNTRPDGSRVHVHLRTNLLKNSLGQPTALVGIGTDVTEQLRAEQALRTSQRQLADLIDFLPDATLAIDRDKRVILWNRAIEQMTGVPASAMLGQGDHAYTIPFYGEARPQLMDLVFQDDPALLTHYPYLRREGERKSFARPCTLRRGLGSLPRYRHCGMPRDR